MDAFLDRIFPFIHTQTLEVEELCHRLRCNDPSLSFLSVDESVWSQGQSEPFSQALLQNEVVDAIELNTQIVAQTSATTQENNSDEEARNSLHRAFTNLLLYFDTNLTLETVRVHNDDDSSLIWNDVCLSTSNVLLVSLAKNSGIISFTSTGWMPCEPLGHYLATAPSLRCVNLTLDTGEGIEEIDTILNGLALNPTMKALNISH
jgi:hypothetical protein